MNQQNLQSLRYKLQKNYQRLIKAHYSNFHFILIQFWNFLKTEPFNSILQRLASEYPQMEDDATETIRRAKVGNSSYRCLGDTFEEHSALGYFVIKKCAEIESNNDEQEWRLGYIYTGSKADKAAYIREFVFNFVEPLYEFLDDSLDTNIAISDSLIRYKKRSEWFKRESLLKLCQDNTQKGEKNLSKDLYEYLFEQGIDFSIEPESISGRADLVLAQNSPTPLVADAKVFNGNKSYLLKGFRQVYQYTIDYNQSYGYLIIFKICEDDLKFEVNQNNQLLPFVVHNNKTIFFLTIDIHNYDKSASQRGKLKSYVIKELELIEAMEEAKDV